MMDEIIKAIVSVIKPVCPLVYFGRSSVKYPKVVGDLRRLSSEDGIWRLRLTLDFYVVGDNIDAVSLADKTREKLYKLSGNTENGYLAFRGVTDCYSVEEKDNEKIAHYVENYEVSYFLGKEE